MPTLNILIATGADDGHYRPSVGGFNNSVSLTYIGRSSSIIFYTSFYRFQNVTIPPGSVVVSASVRLIAQASNSNLPANMLACGELALNPSAVASQADGDARTKTLATTAWSEPAWTSTNTYNTADISAIIQEIIDQSGWSSGNAVQLFIGDNGGSHIDSLRSVRSYNGSTVNCARLDITYTEPPTGNRRRRVLLAA